MKKWAQKVQQPWIKQEIADCISGKQGTGKSSIFLLFARIFGINFAHIQNSVDLVGNYTSAIAEKIMVFVDECNFQDNTSEQIHSKLKPLTTESDPALLQ